MKGRICLLESKCSYEDAWQHLFIMCYIEIFWACASPQEYQKHLLASKSRSVFLVVSEINSGNLA